MAPANATTITAVQGHPTGVSEQATPKGGSSAKGGSSTEAPKPPKPCWRKVCDSGPLGVMCFYLLKWHSRIAILFGYTSLLLVTMVLLCCSGYFKPGHPGYWKPDFGGNSTSANNSSSLTTNSTAS